MAIGRWKIHEVDSDEATRKDGRHIDYCVVSSSLKFIKREQKSTTSDHDLICFHLQLQDKAKQTRHRALTMQLRKSGMPIADEELAKAFAERCDAFADAVRQGDSEEAWIVLSGAAEDMLAEGGEGGNPDRIRRGL